MDAILHPKINHLLSLVRDLEKGRAAHIFPGGLAPLIEGIQQLAPRALICLLATDLPDDIRLASAVVILAILLDSDHLQRYGLIVSLEHAPIRDYIQPLLVALAQDDIPAEVRQLGQIATRQIHSGCNTYACTYHRVISTRGLLYALTGYAH